MARPSLVFFILFAHLPENPKASRMWLDTFLLTFALGIYGEAENLNLKQFNKSIEGSNRLDLYC